MSEDIVQPIVDNNDVTELITTLATPVTDPPLNESDAFPTPSDSEDAANNSAIFGAESLVYNNYSIFGTFVVIELVMTTLELIISIVAAIKMERWRKNYRNQMLMQLTVARFIKRIIFTFKFLECRDKITDSEAVANFLYCFQLYIDLVIAVLVFFFIKHMYNSLIIVLVKISQNSFYKVMSYSWLIPIPIVVVCSVIIATDFVDKWYVNLLMCSVFRWPLIFVGTGVYIAIVYRILSDRIRQFARSLAVNKTQSSRSLPDYSLADANMKC
ncbi:hypothetical protein HF086_016208 [Spodoptera exigua]|uniref:Uncharacterized protein n=1 Tax=Spodoptera exigua TaxID=7107 RepID=A0A922SGQ2_SPOEX|nr:hypothetical protein HF086_016208 [Spodoptera exigua]